MASLFALPRPEGCAGKALGRIPTVLPSTSRARAFVHRASPDFALSISARGRRKAGSCLSRRLPGRKSQWVPAHNLVGRTDRDGGLVGQISVTLCRGCRPYAHSQHGAPKQTRFPSSAPAHDVFIISISFYPITILHTAIALSRLGKHRADVVTARTRSKSSSDRQAGFSCLTAR
ncbi:hypothetical protein LX36DRAFT_172759 [Colletotrichum falcatum]|nr:hypothetical protein LX36DRAFT_172759 [Colletotrichum falcatum]